MQRNKRLLSQTRPPLSFTAAEARTYEAEFKPETQINYKVVNPPLHKKVTRSFPVRLEKQEKPAKHAFYRKRLSWKAGLVFLMFLAFALIWTLNNPKPPPEPTPEWPFHYYWQEK